MLAVAIVSTLFKYQSDHSTRNALWFPWVTYVQVIQSNLHSKVDIPFNLILSTTNNILMRSFGTKKWWNEVLYTIPEVFPLMGFPSTNLITSSTPYKLFSPHFVGISPGYWAPDVHENNIEEVLQLQHLNWVC